MRSAPILPQNKKNKKTPEKRLSEKLLRRYSANPWRQRSIRDMYISNTNALFYTLSFFSKKPMLKTMPAATSSLAISLTPTGSKVLEPPNSGVSKSGKLFNVYIYFKTQF